MTLVNRSSMPADLLPATVVPGLEAFTTVLAGVMMMEIIIKKQIRDVGSTG